MWWILVDSRVVIGCFQGPRQFVGRGVWQSLQGPMGLRMDGCVILGAWELFLGGGHGLGVLRLVVFRRTDRGEIVGFVEGRSVQAIDWN